MKITLSLFAAMLACPQAAAFVVSRQTRSMPAVAATKLTDIELMGIENTAELCVADVLVEDCDLEEHEALVNRLQEQKDILGKEVAEIDSILSKLKGHTVDGHSLGDLAP
eukprot:CAMPEP_0119546276 /NCGR_PEP_ID=MMETSP1352-20130426/770_1 /TAXON_ID=265584 /ORGANISM="Stauroneis constricta, Strain CCMP1120" /LENGTH=109 /DNA_ID=CAMNT_0007590965 /DNA_START=98 /DNA_END=427 /DNA_ORIENTATION=-